MKPIIYLGLPLGSRTGHDFETIVSWCNGSVRCHDLYDVIHKVSFKGHNFVNLWAEALDLRREGVTHYAGMHGDVVPVNLPLHLGWADVGMKILEEHQAKVVSFVVTLKDNSGHTSTGYSRRWPPGAPTTKLTRKAVAALPEPFSIRDVKPDDEQGHYCLSVHNGLF